MADVKKNHPSNQSAIVLGISAWLLLVLLLDLRFYPQTLEDAFIIFRYSAHLAAGHGLGAWNIVGPRVEGYTTFSWMLLMALAPWLHISMLTWSKMWGLIFHLALCGFFMAAGFSSRLAALFPGWEEKSSRDVFLMAGLILGLYFPMNFYATTGMETVFFSALVAGVFFIPWFTSRAWLLASLAAVMVLTRPEGIWLGAAAWGFHFWQARTQPKPDRPLRLALMAGVISGLALLILRVVLFRDLVPNPYHAKVAGALGMHVQAGWSYLQTWMLVHRWWVILGLATLALLIRQVQRAEPGPHTAVAWLTAVVVLNALYILRTGGDNPYAFPYWRQWLHSLPVVAVFLGFGIAMLIPHSRPWRYALLAGLLISADFNVMQQKDMPLFSARNPRFWVDPFRLAHTPPNPYYLWLARMAKPDTVIASSLGGELPYVIDAVHLDLLGLNDRHIAHHGQYDPQGPVDSKTDMDYIFRQKPDVIEGYFSGKKVLSGLEPSKIITGRAAMGYAIIRHPIFQAEYMFVANAPYDDLDRALFFHRDFFTTHPLRNQLQAIPVSATSLSP